jgi:hypothetical protein
MMNSSENLGKKPSKELLKKSLVHKKTDRIPVDFRYGAERTSSGSPLWICVSENRTLKINY